MGINNRKGEKNEKTKYIHITHWHVGDSDGQ